MYNKNNYKSYQYLYNQWVVLKKSQSQIAKENNVSTSTIEYWIKKNKLIHIRSKSKYEHSSYKYNLFNPVFCHFLGFISADGYIRPELNRVEITIMEKDKSILELYNNYFQLNYNIKTYSIKNKTSKKVVLHITSKQLITILTSLGINIKQKTFNLKFPTLPSLESYRYFIRGVIDGDGNIRKRGFRIVTASKIFMEGLVNFINQNFSTNYKLTFQKNIYPKLEIGSFKGNEIIKWIYYKNEHIALKRKLNKVKQYK